MSIRPLFALTALLCAMLLAACGDSPFDTGRKEAVRKQADEIFANADRFYQARNYELAYDALLPLNDLRDQLPPDQLKKLDDTTNLYLPLRQEQMKNRIEWMKGFDRGH